MTAVTKKGTQFPVNTKQFSVTVRDELRRAHPCPGPITLWAGIIFGLQDSAKIINLSSLNEHKQTVFNFVT